MCTYIICVHTREGSSISAECANLNVESLYVYYISIYN